MSKDPAEEMLARISSKVADSQVGIVHRLKGQYVERNGVVFLVVDVDWRKGQIVVSDVKTPVEQTTRFRIRPFLSKAIRLLGEHLPEAI